MDTINGDDIIEASILLANEIALLITYGVWPFTIVMENIVDIYHNEYGTHINILDTGQFMWGRTLVNTNGDTGQYKWGHWSIQMGHYMWGHWSGT